MQYAYISGYKQMGFKIINACTCSKKIPLEFYNLIRDKYPRYFPEMERVGEETRITDIYQLRVADVKVGSITTFMELLEKP